MGTRPSLTASTMVTPSLLVLFAGKLVVVPVRRLLSLKLRPHSAMESTCERRPSFFAVLTLERRPSF